jgi:hypothetical protein
MFSYRTFHDTFYCQFEHFVIHSVDENIRTLFMHEKINELNHRFIVRRIRSSINTISLKRISWKKSLICSFQYRKNVMIMISQIMCRHRKRCYEFLCDEQLEFFASNRFHELLSSCSNERREMKLRTCWSMILWIKFVFESNYLSFLFAIHVLNFRCDLFISST